jgi:hypothetical protein
MLIDGISRKGLQQLVVQVLQAANTLAGANVFEPMPWPDTIDKLPMVVVQTPHERKVCIFPGQAAFTTTITLSVVGRIAGVPGQEVQLNESLDTLSGQIEDALLTSPALLLAVQKWATIETQTVVSAEGKYFVGEIGMLLEVEVYQAFGPSGDPLTNFTGTIHPDGTIGVGNPIIIQSTV